MAAITHHPLPNWQSSPYVISIISSVSSLVIFILQMSPRMSSMGNSYIVLSHWEVGTLWILLDRSTHAGYTSKLRYSDVLLYHWVESLGQEMRRVKFSFWYSRVVIFRPDYKTAVVNSFIELDHGVYVYLPTGLHSPAFWQREITEVSLWSRHF